MAEYPQPLADALVAAAWEASFSIANARKAVDRVDLAYVAGCLFRAVGVLAHAIHGRDHRWLLNEKGAVAATDRLPSSPAGFASKVAASIGAIAATERDLTTACDRLERLSSEVLAILT